MKTKYIKPESILVDINLSGSVLDKGDVYGGSKAAAGQAWTNDSDIDWEEDDAMLNQPNLWDE